MPVNKSAVEGLALLHDGGGPGPYAPHGWWEIQPCGAQAKKKNMIKAEAVPQAGDKGRKSFVIKILTLSSLLSGFCALWFPEPAPGKAFGGAGRGLALNPSLLQ